MHSLGCRSCARCSGLLVLPQLGAAGFQASAASVRHSLGEQGLCRVWWAAGWLAVCWGFRDSALPAFTQIHDHVGEIRPKVCCGVRLCSHFCVVTRGSVLWSTWKYTLLMWAFGLLLSYSPSVFQEEDHKAAVVEVKLRAWAVGALQKPVLGTGQGGWGKFLELTTTCTGFKQKL